MERRDVLKILTGSPLVLAGVTLPDVYRQTVLLPASVGADFEVYDLGEGLRFSLRLLQKPWPSVGQRVSFTYQDLHLEGTVSEISLKPVSPRMDRLWCDVRGTVQMFDGNPVVDA